MSHRTTPSIFLPLGIRPSAHHSSNLVVDTAIDAAASSRRRAKRGIVLIGFSDEQLAELDKWRRNQEDLPNRSEVVRRLVDGGLEQMPRRQTWKGFLQLSLVTCPITVIPAASELDVSFDQINIRLRPSRLGVLLDVAATPSQGVKDDETEILSVPVRLRRAGREIRMVIEGTDPFATAKPNARLVKLLLRARRFNAALTQGEGIAFAALAQREGVSRSYEVDPASETAGAAS